MGFCSPIKLQFNFYPSQTVSSILVVWDLLPVRQRHAERCIFIKPTKNTPHLAGGNLKKPGRTIFTLCYEKCFLIMPDINPASPTVFLKNKTAGNRKITGSFFFVYISPRSGSCVKNRAISDKIIGQSDQTSRGAHANMQRVKIICRVMLISRL